MTRQPATAWLDTGLPTECPCQWGPTGHCHQDRHGTCGAHVVELPETDIWTTGLAPAAPVWLADRVCRWQCPCECHTDRPEQLDLFA